MRIDDFITRYQLKTPCDEQGFPHRAKQSAVMILAYEEAEQTQLLLCKRPSYLKHHPAQICFPGGKLEPSDRSLLDTAYRESYEELGVSQNNIQLLGEMASYWTLTGFEIKPYVGVLNSPFSLNLDPQEVALTFSLSIEALQRENNWQDIHFSRAGKRYTLSGYHTQHGVLWGATAQLIKNLIKHIY